MLHFFLLCLSILVMIIIFLVMSKMDGPIRTKLFSIVKWGIGIVIGGIILIFGGALLYDWNEKHDREVQLECLTKIRFMEADALKWHLDQDPWEIYAEIDYNHKIVTDTLLEIYSLMPVLDPKWKDLPRDIQIMKYRRRLDVTDPFFNLKGTVCTDAMDAIKKQPVPLGTELLKSPHLGDVFYASGNGINLLKAIGYQKVNVISGKNKR